MWSYYLNERWRNSNLSVRHKAAIIIYSSEERWNIYCSPPVQKYWSSSPKLNTLLEITIGSKMRCCISEKEELSREPISMMIEVGAIDYAFM